MQGFTWYMISSRFDILHKPAPTPTNQRGAVERERASAREAPLQFLRKSVRALLPTLTVDTAGMTLVYYVLLPHFSITSIWPVLCASLVPAVSNIFNFTRRRSLDIVGLIILLSVLVSQIPAAFGGSQRLLLLRESSLTGLVGMLLVISTFFMRKPILYYVIREFLMGNDSLPKEQFQMLWETAGFRRGMRTLTIGWGLLLTGDFCLRAFMALHMNIGFVLGVAPVLLTALLLLAGAATAIWLSRAIARTF